jgi:hypothetical protein
LQFYEREKTGDRQQWIRENQSVRAQWSGDAPEPGTHVVVEPDKGLILTPDFVELGILKSSIRRPLQDIVSARVGNSYGTVLVEFFGPRV